MILERGGTRSFVASFDRSVEYYVIPNILFDLVITQQPK